MESLVLEDIMPNFKLKSIIIKRNQLRWEEIDVKTNELNTQRNKN